MTHPEFVALVRSMRDAQKQYFRLAKAAIRTSNYQVISDRQRALQQSLDLEGRVDAEVEDFGTPRLPL